MRYAADPPAGRRTLALDTLTLVYHRRSGQTHILAEPAPSILAALADGAGAVEDVAGRIGNADVAGVAASLDELVAAGLAWRDMTHIFSVQVGPAAFRIGSAWREPVRALERLYEGYPQPAIAEFTVRLKPARPWRRWLRPAVDIAGDFVLPDAAPLPLAHGLLAAEMGMNLQMAFGQRRFLLLHAATVERGGRALILAGCSGAGKSTLAALLGERGWRLMGDEFALIDPETGLVHAFPRPVSLKNGAIGAVGGEEHRLGPLLAGTPKGDIRHLRPAPAAIVQMAVPAQAALLLFPRFGLAVAERAVSASEAFVRLTQASTNYTVLGEPAFVALSDLVRAVPAWAIDYPDTTAALAAVDARWRQLG